MVFVTQCILTNSATLLIGVAELNDFVSMKVKLD
jgi:hypothetical protein